ncbi:MAG: phosphoribosylglycinamide formyltransferase [Gemmatimonadetes bacterium]|nr:MAG: phosphoribosylglycinamide formyltransferase [Gemmatimonadota bacterium]PYP52887.1 MAG: phosphoribosylglycinamide formyltransferase [Gemmatimonadota bacterium]
MPRDPLPRCRKLALSLPEAHEVQAWGEPTFRVKNKIFAMYAHANTHHGSGRNAVWCKAAPVNQRLMVDAAPERFFVPPYVGPSGWIGVWLDGDIDWAELQDLLRDAWRMTAPKKLVAALKRD